MPVRKGCIVCFLSIFILAQFCPSAFASPTMSDKGKKLASTAPDGLEGKETQKSVKPVKTEVTTTTPTTEDPFAFGNDLDSG